MLLNENRPNEDEIQNEVQQDNPLFTVFTATFNRAHTLHRVFDSLQSQTFRDFEWLIVDDGSSDQTRSLVEGWQQTADFPIRYFWQPNQGKHFAFNKGVEIAKGEMLLILDSDDTCLPCALERFAFHWRSLSAVQQAQFCGVMCLCAGVQGNIIGSRFPQDVMDGNHSELIYRYKVEGEKWWILRTEVLKQFPFPAVGLSKYIPESIVWRQIARHYPWRFINEALRTYYEGEAGTADQLTRAPMDKISLGGTMDNQARLDDEIQWFRHAPFAFLRTAALYSRFSFHLGKGTRAQIRGLRQPLARLLWGLGLPIGYIFYLRDSRQR